MPDKSIVIANFRFGLDSRRSELASQPGTLVVAENGHINSGAEFEKRFSFVADANTYPTNTFGLQDSDAGLLTFGSDAAPGSALPTGVSYVRLQHPAVTDTYVTYDPALHAMVAVVSSTNYNGNAVVLAKFSDGHTFMYYDGTIVSATRNGIVFSGETPLIFMAAVAARNVYELGEGWQATYNVDPNNTTINGLVLIYSPPGVHFTGVPSFQSASGELSQPILVDQNVPGFGGRSAGAAFAFDAGTTGTVDVQAPPTAVSFSFVSLTNGPIAFSGLSATAQAVVDAINQNTYATGYKAVYAAASPTTVTVYAPASFGNVTFNLKVIGTGDVSTTTGSVVAAFTATATPNPLIKTKKGTHTQMVNGTISISYAGNAGAVTFSWVETGTSGIVMSSTTAPNVSFSKSLAPGDQATGYFVCTVTDAGGGPPPTVVIAITVILSLESGV